MPDREKFDELTVCIIVPIEGQKLLQCLLIRQSLPLCYFPKTDTKPFVSPSAATAK